MIDLSQVAVVIPALNEERSLPLVLADLPAVGRVVVIDNGSTDRTAEVAQRQGATVITEPRRGYGSACLAGLEHLRIFRGENILRHSGANSLSIVVFLDADYSDYPEELPLLVGPIVANEVDFVLGSRLAGTRETGAIPPQSVWGNRLACWLMRLVWRTAYTDLGPFRAIRWDALEALGMRDRDFGWTIEMQIKAAQVGLRTLEIPVSYRRRVGASKISGTAVGTVKAGTKILYTVAKYALRSRSSGEVNSRFEREEAAT